MFENAWIELPETVNDLFKDPFFFYFKRLSSFFKIYLYNNTSNYIPVSVFWSGQSIGMTFFLKIGRKKLDIKQVPRVIRLIGTIYNKTILSFANISSKSKPTAKFRNPVVIIAVMYCGVSATGYTDTYPINAQTTQEMIEMRIIEVSRLENWL